MAYLSYADFYRPRFFLLENVRNFVAYSGGRVFRLVLRTLLDLGYQVCSGCGCRGVGYSVGYKVRDAMWVCGCWTWGTRWGCNRRRVGVGYGATVGQPAVHRPGAHHTSQRCR